MRSGGLWALFTGSEQKRGFSSEAPGYVTSIDPKVILIDGRQLAEFMLDFSVGVNSVTSYEIKKSTRIISMRNKKHGPITKKEVVVQDAESRQPLLDIAARASEEEGIRQGLEDVKKGKSRPIKEFFAEFEAKHGIPR